jgi:hypothetical protein
VTPPNTSTPQTYGYGFYTSAVPSVGTQFQGPVAPGSTIGAPFLAGLTGEALPGYTLLTVYGTWEATPYCTLTLDGTCFYNSYTYVSVYGGQNDPWQQGVPAFLGISFINQAGQTLYGWAQVKTSADLVGV